MREYSFYLPAAAEKKGKGRRGGEKKREILVISYSELDCRGRENRKKESPVFSILFSPETGREGRREGGGEKEPARSPRSGGGGKERKGLGDPHFASRGKEGKEEKKKKKSPTLRQR